VDRDRDKKFGKPSAFAPSPEPDSEVPIIGPHNPALGEIYQRLYPEMRRPKPDQVAIAAALQAMQRLTMEADSEAPAEDATVESGTACSVCGHHNRKGNKFCGMCGLAAGTPAPDSPETAPSTPASPVLEDEPSPQTPPSAPQAKDRDDKAKDEVHPPAGAPGGTHHYHHHYHHHYFQGAQNDGVPAVAPRLNSSESAREADRMRVAAAAKGEPMSRGEAAVRRLTQEWVLACNTRQLDELIELYAPDALVLRSNLPPIRGAMAVREFFYASLEAGLGEVALDPMRVEVLGDLAHEVGRYSALVPGSSGKRREERGKYLWVFAECWSSDLTLTGAESDAPKAIVSSAKTQPRRG
jgi:uncharacterized protein (TIGR02246 family)